ENCAGQRKPYVYNKHIMLAKAVCDFSPCVCTCTLPSSFFEDGGVWPTRAATISCGSAATLGSLLPHFLSGRIPSGRREWYHERHGAAAGAPYPDRGRLPRCGGESRAVTGVVGS